MTAAAGVTQHIDVMPIDINACGEMQRFYGSLLSGYLAECFEFFG